MSKLIAIDNGHGLNTPGKRCPDDSMREWQFNHATAKYLKEELEYNGFKTLMVSDTKEDTPLETRVARINNAKADMSISIHANAFQGTYWGEANGIETFAYSTTSKGNAIAKLVQEELIKATGLRNRGVKYNRLYMTRKPKCPAILCECGFMDNLKEAKLLKSDDYRKKCAKAMCKGICRYYGVDYKEKQQPQEKPTTSDIIYRVICGSYSKKANGEKQMDKLKANGFSSFLNAKKVNGMVYYRVIVGSYSLRENAQKQIDKLKAKGFNSFIEIYKK